MTSNRTKVRIAALFAAAGIACGGAVAEAPTRDHTIEATGNVKSALSEADQLAREYGRDHLGHYLKLKLHHLTKAGLEVPSDVSLKVGAGHYGYCITVTSKQLPKMHPWAVATSGLHTDGVQVQDRCPRR